jgi:hypothetical protein
MAVTLAEELPEFVDKGRQRVQLQVGNAKIVGRFVVTRGQRRLSDRIGSVLHGTDDDTDVRDGGVRDVNSAGGVGGETGQQWRGRDGVPSFAAPPRPESGHLSPPDPAAAAIVERALADYDTLSASQVVRRLEAGRRRRRVVDDGAGPVGRGGRPGRQYPPAGPGPRRSPDHAGRTGPGR